jgi:glycosyltransferase involved in cell wall biosynthesis
MTSDVQAVYFDITDIVGHAMKNTHVTGIQRSVLKVIESIVRKGDRSVFGIIKHPLNESFLIADLSFMKGHYDLDDFHARFDLPSGKRLWLSGKLLRYKKTPLRRAFHYARLQLRWASSGKLRAKFRRPSLSGKPSCLREEKLNRGGIIVILGAGWGTDYVGLTELASIYDCKAVSFVHDIIALLTPQHTAFFTADKNRRLERWLHYVSRHSSLLVCNSDYTRETLENYLSGLGVQVKIEVVKLPHEFKRSAERCAISEDVTDITRQDYVLCVGTIEARKNIRKLLECWQELRNMYKADLPKLVLAGGKGWGIDDVYEFLKDTSNVEGTVRIIDGPNDAELELLYQNCQFTVFPSLFEGWGLPIGESLWFGKPVICANNASMPEVGEAFAAYFDHAQPNSLFEALKNMIDQPVTLPKDIRKLLRTWNDTASSLMETVAKHTRPKLMLRASSCQVYTREHYSDDGGES